MSGLELVTPGFLLREDLKDHPDIMRTLEFAATAHKAQKRKGDAGHPYHTHVIDVANRLSELYWNSLMREAPILMLMACLLHDTVEDTNTKFQDIRREFGMTVCTLVYWLSELDGPELGNREIRKSLVAEKLRFAPLEVRIIKQMDLDSNAVSLELVDPKFYNGAFKPEFNRLMFSMGTSFITKEMLQATIDAPFRAVRPLDIVPVNS